MFKVGDRVILREYLNDYLTGNVIFREYMIIKMENDKIAELDGCFASSVSTIHIDHLYTLKEYRTKKLREICSMLETE